MNVKTLKSWTLQSFALRGNGGAQVYEGYEVKKKRGKITLSFISPEKVFLFMKSLFGKKIKYWLDSTTCVYVGEDRCEAHVCMYGVIYGMYVRMSAYMYVRMHVRV